MQSKELSRTVYTIGHSTHSLERFYEIISVYEINCIIDVRSTPASKFNPQYNQEPFKNYLNKHGKIYMHFQKEFGARHTNPDLLSTLGKVDFAKVQQSHAFKNGIERVDIGLMKGYNIVLMCSEGDPLECHRFSMISSVLHAQGIEVIHILRNANTISHVDLIQGMIKKYRKKISGHNLFEGALSKSDLLKEAYKLHNEDIAWSPSLTFNNNLYTND